MNSYIVFHGSRRVKVTANNAAEARARAAEHLSVKEPWALDCELYEINGRRIGNVSLSPYETIH